MKIVIFTQSPISKAPRVIKEANSLASHGYNITVFGLWHNISVIKDDFGLLNSGIIYKPGMDMSIQNLNVTFQRVKRRFYRECARWFRIQSKHALGYGYYEYLKKLKAEKADLYIGHEEMSLALAKKLIKEGYKVAFDFEDFHSQDLLPKDRLYRPNRLLSKLEKFVLKNVVYSTTASDSLANEFAKEYNGTAPVTVYNSFHRHESEKNFNFVRTSKSIVWISQVIGPGRGLEILIEGISLSKYSYELTLIGKKDLEFCTLISNSSVHNLKIVFSEFIHPKQIATELEKFDVGIAFEERNPKSRNLTVTNKVFHYLNSGLAILATNTKGQREMNEKTKGVISVVPPDPSHICENLEQLFSDDQELALRKQQSSYYGNEVFCFEHEEQKILKLVRDVLE